MDIGYPSIVSSTTGVGYPNITDSSSAGLWMMKSGLAAFSFSSLLKVVVDHP